MCIGYVCSGSVYLGDVRLSSMISDDGKRGEVVVNGGLRVDIGDSGIPTADSSENIVYAAQIKGGVLATNYNSVSDARIKKDIVELNDKDALIELRKIQPTTYYYRDWMSRGKDQVIGFIAQQVKDVFPFAVKSITDYVPNVYRVCVPVRVQKDDSITRVYFKRDDYRELIVIGEGDSVRIIREDGTKIIGVARIDRM